MALVLGIAAGTVTRRTVPAILLTFALILGIRWAVVIGGLRANFEPPILVTWPLAQGDNPPITLNYQDWRINDGWVNAQGQITNSLRCTQVYPSALQCAEADWYRSYGLAYQPANRFWTFQWIETGPYLAITALPIAVTVCLVRRRLA